MILTQCPSCRTLFRLEVEALEACGGAVRCGQCAAVFQADVYRIDEAASRVEETRAAPRRWPFVVLVVLLTLGLAAQGLYAGRATLARIAQTRPLIRLLCRGVSCDLPHPAALARWHLVRPHIGLTAAGDVLRIRAGLRNTAAFGQSLPLLSVTLINDHGHVVARANYQAAHYLRHPRARLGPGQTAVIRLALHVPAGAVGYRLGLFASTKD